MNEAVQSESAKNELTLPAGESSSESAWSEQRESSVVSREVRNGQFVFTKRYFDAGWFQSEDTLRAQVVREADVIRRLPALPGFGRRLGVLSVIDCRPQQLELVTAEVSGCELQHVLNGNDEHRERTILRAAFLAGKWLNVYQTMPIDDCDRISLRGDFENMVDYCEMRIDRLYELGYRCPNAVSRSRLLECMASLLAASPADEQARVWCHADYAPNNIMWDGRMLTPIDFGMACIERPLLDVTYFIHRLEMQKIYRPWRRWPIANWTRAFLRGYGRPDAEESPMYRAMMIRHLLCRLVTYVRRPPRNLKQRLHNRYVRACVRRRLLQAVLNAAS